MKIIVLKFGGTSVGSIHRIKEVAKIIKSYCKKYKVIVLSSAMSGTTNNLVSMSQKLAKIFLIMSMIHWFQLVSRFHVHFWQVNYLRMALSQNLGWPGKYQS